MVSLTLNQFLTLYTWFPLAGLLLLLLSIARFYEKFSGERTYFRGFTVPLILFGAASVRYASIDQLFGDAAADALLGAGGILLTVLSLNLYRLMILQRPAPDDEDA